MSQFNLKKSISIACIEYYKWIYDARMIILAVLFVFLKLYVVDPLVDNAEQMGQTLNAFEPFVALVNSGLTMLIIPLVFLALIADFPKVDTNTVFLISRAGRVNWLTGQLIKLIMMILSFMLVLLLGTMLPVLFHCHFGGDWSEVITEFADKFPDKRESFGASLIPENIYYQYTLVKAILGCCLLVFSYLFIIGMIMLLFTVINMKKLGFFVGVSIISIGTVLCATNSFLMWFFPYANSILWIHYTKYFREPEFSLLYSVLYMIVGGFLLVSVCYLLIDRLNYSAISEVES